MVNEHEKSGWTIETKKMNVSECVDYHEELIMSTEDALGLKNATSCKNIP